MLNAEDTEARADQERFDQRFEKLIVAFMACNTLTLQRLKLLRGADGFRNVPTDAFFQLACRVQLDTVGPLSPRQSSSQQAFNSSTTYQFGEIET
jgi:hypothetical protein